MTAKRSSSKKGSQPSRRRRSTPTRRRRTTKKTKRSLPTISLTLDQWLDLAGLGLVSLALLTFLSFLSNQGALTGWWLGLLRTTFGWGVFAVPVGLAAIGMWLILRRFEDKRPQVAPEVGLGIALAFLAALASMHLLARLFYDEELSELARQGLGGGRVGLWLDNLLLNAVGGWGAAVVLLALWVVALILALGISVVELAQLVGRALAWTRARAPSQPDLVINPRAEPARAAELEPAPQPIRPASRSKKKQPQPAAPPPAPAADPIFPQAHIIGDQKAWRLPVVKSIFTEGDTQDVSEDEIRERAQIIESTLNSFGVPGRVTEVNRGPVITQFGVEPGFITGRSGKKTKVKVSRISSLSNDLALALAARRIRIQAPVPGKNIVGIEVPNAEVALVVLRDVVETDDFKRLQKKGPLPLPLGQDVSGRAISADLTTMPHLLVAGATGSGKSVCINSFLASMLSFNTPDQLKLILVDPKRVELLPYSGLPHLMAPVVVDLERVVGTLQWVTREMDSRYRKFAKMGARNITDHNRRIVDQTDKESGEKALPYIVVVIDELADLMMLAPQETERSICRLAQMARATGIHLIISTQRPSVNVVTGLIKANFPARISFAVASSVDSRVVLDMVGAERLLGRGDMLFMSPDAGQPRRLQGVFVSDQELQKLMRHWRGVRGVTEQVEIPPKPMVQQPLWEEMQEEKKAPEDVLLDDAVTVIQEAGRASISLLQRRLRIGYTRAARLIDLLEEQGIIGPATGGSHAREVLVDKKE